MTIFLFFPVTDSLNSLDGQTQSNNVEWIHSAGGHGPPRAAGSIVWAVPHCVHGLHGG